MNDLNRPVSKSEILCALLVASLTGVVFFSPLFVSEGSLLKNPVVYFFVICSFFFILFRIDSWWPTGRPPPATPRVGILPPIIIEERGDLALFRSAADAERHLEPVDVENEEYRAYDGIGHRLTLGVARKEKRFFCGILRDTVEVVTLRDESGVDAAEELRQILRRYLERRGRNGTNTAGAALEELIEQVVQVAGYCS